jgi:hypothetical protein
MQPYCSTANLGRGSSEKTGGITADAATLLWLLQLEHVSAGEGTDLTGGAVCEGQHACASLFTKERIV